MRNTRLEADENGYRKYSYQEQINRRRTERDLEARRRTYENLPVYQDPFGVKYYYCYGLYWSSSKERFLELVKNMKPEPLVTLKKSKYVSLFHTASITGETALRVFEYYDMLFIDPDSQTDLIKVVSDLF